VVELSTFGCWLNYFWCRTKLAANGRGYEQWRLRGCVCIPRAELAARRNIEHATNPLLPMSRVTDWNYYFHSF